MISINTICKQEHSEGRGKYIFDKTFCAGQHLNDLISNVTKSCSRIKDIDLIMHKFDSVLPCKNSEHFIIIRAVVLQLYCKQTHKNKQANRLSNILYIIFAK